MGAREEAERRWPKAAGSLGVDDAVEGFVLGAEWHAEQAYADTDERVEVVAQTVKRVKVAFGGPHMQEFANDPPTAKDYAIARAALAALREMGASDE